MAAHACASSARPRTRSCRALVEAFPGRVPVRHGRRARRSRTSSSHRTGRRFREADAAEAGTAPRERRSRPRAPRDRPLPAAEEPRRRRRGARRSSVAPRRRPASEGSFRGRLVPPTSSPGRSSSSSSSPRSSRRSPSSRTAARASSRACSSSPVAPVLDRARQGPRRGDARPAPGRCRSSPSCPLAGLTPGRRRASSSAARASSSLLAFALTALGFAIAWSLESTQGFHAIMNLFLIPMWLLSGAFFPVDGAPAWLRCVMAVNPLTYGVAALRRGARRAAPGSSSGPGLSVRRDRRLRGS